MHEELAPHGLTVITVALDTDPNRVLPWVEAAQPSHPSLVDTRFRLAELYNIVNVPTTIWIDEDGRIARPNDTGFVTDTFTSIHDIRSEPVIRAIREWVHVQRPGMTEAEVRAWQQLPDATHQLARAEFALATWLARNGHQGAAERHFLRAGELAPHDFTIRRGSMPLRGRDPFGADFVELYNEWLEQGRPYYDKMRR